MVSLHVLCNVFHSAAIIAMVCQMELKVLQAVLRKQSTKSDSTNHFDC